ncbi:hypothetical protein [Nafulsella turpanensis]|uniref:hypothetical protein n=1 Tax=Nafulsella turpanensis TaxID=1265690 RepID=UPI00036B8AE2|nr:hypothetical protein [Nafulsella turpanensis]
MKKRLVALFFTMVLFLGFPSCKDDSIDCSIAGEFFDINGIEIDNYQISESRFDNGHYWKQVEGDETIPFDEFFMRVFFEVDYYLVDPKLRTAFFEF